VDVYGRVLLVSLLVISGVAGAQPAVAPRDPAQPVHRFFIIGVGFGGWSRLSTLPPNGGSAFSFQLGQRLWQGLHLVEQVDVIGPAFSSDAGLREDHGALLVGIRWTPFHSERRLVPGSKPFPNEYLDFLALYARLSLGAGVTERSTPTSHATIWLPTGSAALGYLPLQGRDWALGYEARLALTHFNEGFQRDWDLMIVAQLSN
jgi:hypothetical protein